MAAKKSFRALNVRGELKAHSDITHRGVPMYTPRRYVCLLFCPADVNPTVTELMNTLGGNPEWLRANAGEWQMLLEGKMPKDKTIVRATVRNTDEPAVIVAAQVIDDDVVKVTGLNTDGEQVDGGQFSIEVEVYTHS